MNGLLSREDYQMALELQIEGWLTPVQSEKLDHRLDISKGLQLVGCSDCHQREDLFDYIAKFVRPRAGGAIIHPTLLNGGALLLPMVSRVRKMGIPSDAVIIANLLGTRQLKEIATVALYAHAPCGAAGDAGVNLREIIDLLHAAKDRVKNLLTGPGEKPFEVACFCHVDYGHWRNKVGQTNGIGDGHKRNTYFVPRHLPQPPDPAKREELEAELARLEIP